MLCEKCREQKATVHLTLIEPAAEVAKYHYCESCYSKVQKEREGTGHETAERVVTAPSSKVVESAIAKQPTMTGNKCPKCGVTILLEELNENLKVCLHCQHHFRIGARERIPSLVEAGSFEELDPDMTSVDVLEFPGVATYASKLTDSQQATGLKDAVVTGIGKLGEYQVGLAVMDFGFMGGSMGSVVGEKLARLIEKSTQRALPVIIISTSGGARVCEGMFSLMQMAKTCWAVGQHGQAKLPYISVLTDPTTAGVLASFASLGGLIIAEPGAKIGFAGERVIKDATKAELPPGFQTAEFLKDHGLIDAIVARKEMKKQLITYLDFMLRSPKDAAESVTSKTLKK